MVHRVSGTKKIPVGIYTNETFAQCEEARQKGDGVGNKMVELRYSKSKKVQQKRMGRKRETLIHVRKE